MRAFHRAGAPPGAYGDGQALERLAVVKIAGEHVFGFNVTTAYRRWRSYFARRRARWHRRVFWSEAVPA